MYNATMGLGYRPFRLVYWVLGFIILFAFLYFLWIPQQINQYIFKDEKSKDAFTLKRKISNTNTIIHCLYFSSMLFFTIRLRKDILTFFNKKEKRVIVYEYLLGLGIYVSFLTLSKSGSILHTLKSLFIG